MIALRDVIRDGWRDHAAEPLEVAERLAAHVHLVDSAEDAQAFTALAAHAAGAHAGEWARAVALCEAALARVAPESPGSPGSPESPDLPLTAALGTLASMQYVSGEVSAALATEMRAAAMTPDTALGAIVGIRLLIADALGQQRRTEESRAVFESALTLAESGTIGLMGERAVAATSNNITGATLDFPSRTVANDAMMLRAARDLCHKIRRHVHGRRLAHRVVRARAAQGVRLTTSPPIRPIASRRKYCLRCPSHRSRIRRRELSSSVPRSRRQPR